MNLIPLTLPSKKVMYINPTHIISLHPVEDMDFETKERYFGTRVDLLQIGSVVVREAADEIIQMAAYNE